jgi:hypothetical protein
MDKQGWQVVSGLLALAVVGMGFGLMATKGVLEQERNDRPAACVTPDPITVVREVPAEVTGIPYPDRARCMGQTLLIKTEHGMESLTHDGKPIQCM